MDETECNNILNEWIVTLKRKIYANTIKTENPDELQLYRNILVNLNERIRKAIVDQTFEDIQDLEFPNKLTECLPTDINMRSEVLDSISQSFTVHQFNKSPKHEKELTEQ